MHYYLVKLAIVLAVVVGLKRVFKIIFLLPLPRWTNRMPIWLLGLVEIFEIYGWTLIVAMILAGIWQVAEKQ
jgi:hypothetical protein